MLLKTRNCLSFALGVLLFGADVSAQAEVKLKSNSYGRPGYGASITVQVIGKEIFGPVRFVQQLPAGWNAKSLEKKQTGKLSQQGDLLRLLWLEKPVVDTLNFTYELNIPESEKVGYVSLAGKLEYFDAQGNKRSLNCEPSQLRIIPYFSRYQ
jgi:hypothetical protein